MKKLLSSVLLAMLTMVSLNASAAVIDALTAQGHAVNFISKQATNVSPRFATATPSSLQLAHAEPSQALTGANDYYAFNIKGGGWVIIAGDDRIATRPLGYSDKGQFNFNNLPAPLQDLLKGYKSEIEFLQTYEGDDLEVVQPTFNATAGVEPLIKTTWGQEMPYYLQCPIYQGQYSAVGCIATAMAQVMYYWQFPTQSNSIASYNCSSIHQQLSALPATTFDYSKMLLTYCHWDYDLSELIQDTYTDEQAQEVAKLSRYCGQAVKMSYHPDGSGAYTSNQLSAMKSFGYSSNAQYVTKGGSGWWGGGSNYTTAQWESMMKAELDAGRPILYSANDPNDNAGHAFICDGYNSNNYFHFNLGWYGTCDGWYQSTALNMVHRSGEELHFSSGHEMLTGMEPTTYCIITADGLNAPSDEFTLGHDIDVEAVNVNLRTSYNTVNLVFAFTDAAGNRVCASPGQALNKNTFVQGSTVGNTIAIPTTLGDGAYDLKLYYYTTNSNNLTPINCDGGQLNVVGRMAKYGDFDIDDVTKAINDLLYYDQMGIDITDVTYLINYLLYN